MTTMRPVWPPTRRPEQPGVAVTGHDGRITAASFTADGRFLVSGDQRGRTLVSDARTGAVRHELGLMALFCPVTAVASGPRGRVAIGLTDGTVRVAEIGDELVEREPLAPDDGFRAGVDALRFLADGRCLLMRHRDRIRVRDLEDGRVLVDITPQDVALGGSPWTATGGQLALGDGTTVVTCSFRDPWSGRVLRGHTAEVVDLDVLPGLLVSTDAAGVVRTWNVAGGRPLAAFVAAGRPSVDDVTGLLVIPTASGARVVDPRTGDPPRDVARHARAARRRDRAADRLLALADRLPVGADALRDRAEALAPTVFGRRACAGPGLGWALVIGSEEEVDGNLVLTSHTLEFVDRNGLTLDTVRLSGRCAGVVAGDPDRCATLSDDADLHLWSATGDLQATSAVLGGGRVSTVAAAPGAGRIAVGGEDGDLRLIDLTAALPPPGPEDPRAEPARELVVDPDARWAATTTHGRTVAVWDLADGGLRHVFRGHATGVFRNSETNRVALGHDAHGPWLAHADDDGTLRVRDPLSGNRIAIGAGTGGEFVGGAGVRGLAVAERDGRVRLRDPRTGRVAAELVGHTDPVKSVVATSTGLLATAAADGVHVWDVTHPAARYTPTAHVPAGLNTRVQVDPCGRWFAVIGPRSVRLYETTGRSIYEVDLRFPVTADAVAPDGGVLLVGGADGTLAVCTPATGTVTALPYTVPDMITACAVAPEGALVAIGQHGGGLSLWDLDGQAMVAQAEVGGTIARCCWVSPTRLVTAGETGLNLFEVE